MATANVYRNVYLNDSKNAIRKMSVEKQKRMPKISDMKKSCEKRE